MRKLVKGFLLSTLVVMTCTTAMAAEPSKGAVGNGAAFVEKAMTVSKRVPTESTGATISEKRGLPLVDKAVQDAVTPYSVPALPKTVMSQPFKSGFSGYLARYNYQLPVLIRDYDLQLQAIEPLLATNVAISKVKNQPYEESVEYTFSCPVISSEKGTSSGKQYYANTVVKMAFHRTVIKADKNMDTVEKVLNSFMGVSRTNLSKEKYLSHYQSTLNGMVLHDGDIFTYKNIVGDWGEARFKPIQNSLYYEDFDYILKDFPENSLTYTFVATKEYAPLGKYIGSNVIAPSLMHLNQSYKAVGNYRLKEGFSYVIPAKWQEKEADNGYYRFEKGSNSLDIGLFPVDKRTVARTQNNSFEGMYLYSIKYFNELANDKGPNRGTYDKLFVFINGNELGMFMAGEGYNDVLKKRMPVIVYSTVQSEGYWVVTRLFYDGAQMSFEEALDVASGLRSK